MRATQSHATTSLSNSFSIAPARWLSDQCSKCGMIFVIPIQDGPDEEEATNRLRMVVTRHSGCTPGK